jgi:hypothetical protein
MPPYRGAGPWGKKKREPSSRVQLIYQVWYRESSDWTNIASDKQGNG